jgi:undecaprenyl diphosphate synthase
MGTGLLKMVLGENLNKLSMSVSNTTSNLPNHIAIIPDGNRRWARGKNMKPWKGHSAGADRIEEITRRALEMKVKWLTFWGSSADNLKKRSLQEKRELLKIYEEYFERLMNSKEIIENKVKINIIGDWRKQFPANLRRILEKGIEKTKNNSGCFLNFLLAYNGDEDMLECVQKIAKEVEEKIISAKEVGKETIRENLMSACLPDVDLLIRTGAQGDPHNSAGFLMWQTQNSQLHFSSKLFPDFDADEFEKLTKDFTKREVRLGK